MANERDPMTDDRNRGESIRGDMGEHQGGRRPEGESTDRSREESAERLRGTGDDLEDEEFEETEDVEEDEEDEGEGTI